MFCYLFAFDGVTSLALQADPDERRALLAVGHPYWAPDDHRLGVVVDDATDWDQVAELVADSHELVRRRR